MAPRHIDLIHNPHDGRVRRHFFRKERETRLSAAHPINQLAGTGACRVGAYQALPGFLEFWRDRLHYEETHPLHLRILGRGPDTTDYTPQEHGTNTSPTYPGCLIYLRCTKRSNP